MQRTVQDIDSVQVFKALADETRLSIVRKLAFENAATCGGDVIACESVRAMSQPTMSHHFTKLVDAGVILEQKRGTQKLYALNKALLESIGLDIHKI